MNCKRQTTIIVASGLLAWGSAICVGLFTVHIYENTPGRLEFSQPRWPQNSVLRFSPREVNLVMFAHPRCPCTRASLDELRRLLECSEDQITARVLFWMPRDAGREWKETELWRIAAALPDVQVYADENGDEARRFGATTSGYVIVFQEDGSRIFSGGLTVARGRIGNGDAAMALCKLIHHNSSPGTDLPVFGCPLFNSQPTFSESTNSCQK